MLQFLRKSLSKDMDKDLDFLDYHIIFSFIPVCNIMLLLPSNSLESQLSFDVSLVHISLVVKEILTEMRILG